eukprot:14723637-Alexandrium_andersonii.AAC.1
MWLHHRRWISVDGCVASEPIDNIRAPPQGCPWVPIGRLCLTGPPIRLARSRWAAPLLKQLVYLDDRSFFTGDW